MGERLLTILQAANEFNVTRRLLYQAVAGGELVAVRFSHRGRIRLRPGDIEQWIRGHCVCAPAASEPGTNASGQANALAALLPPPEARRFA